MTKRKKRTLVRGNTIYVIGAPPPRWKPTVDRNVPSTWEEFVAQRDERRLEAERTALFDVGDRDEAVGEDAGATTATDHREVNCDNDDSGSDEPQP
jgi:hypothetical protein